MQQKYSYENRLDNKDRNKCKRLAEDLLSAFTFDRTGDPYFWVAVYHRLKHLGEHGYEKT